MVYLYNHLSTNYLTPKIAIPMKRFFSVLLLFFLMQTGSSYAQGGDFAPIGATWHYSYFNSNQNNFYGYIYQEVVKDTVISGQACRKLERMRIGVPRHDQSAPIDSVTMSSIYLYSNPDTVFYYNDIFERFLPLYIFNVEAGDTMTFHVPFILPSDEEGDDTLFQVVVTNVTYKD